MMDKKAVVLVVASLALGMLAGCFTPSQPTVETTKPWEGRYSSHEDAVKALQGAGRLDDGQSVWILQSSTLSRLLRNVDK